MHHHDCVEEGVEGLLQPNEMSQGGAVIPSAQLVLHGRGDIAGALAQDLLFRLGGPFLFECDAWIHFLCVLGKDVIDYSFDSENITTKISFDRVSLRFQEQIIDWVAISLDPSVHHYQCRVVEGV